MYIHHLGNQNVERLNRYRNTEAVKTNSATVGKTDFAEQLQKAVESNSNACCEQCKANSQLIARMMTQSLYMQSGLGGLAGLSTLSSSAKAALAYQSMSGMLGSVFGSI